MRVLVVIVIGLLSACTTTPAEDPSLTHRCETLTNGMVECHAVE